MRKGDSIMVTTTNLLTAFMLGGWLAVAPAAFAATPNAAIQKANTYLGEARQAGIVPNFGKPQPGRLLTPNVRRQQTSGGMCRVRVNNRCMTNAQARAANVDPYAHLNQ
jgi:hypothetical protein